MQLGLGLGLQRPSILIPGPRLKTAGKVAVLALGQSLMDYWFSRGQPVRVSVFAAGLMASAFGFTPKGAFNSYNYQPQYLIGGVPTNVYNKVAGHSVKIIVSDGASANDNNFTVQFVNAASGGSCLLASTARAGGEAQPTTSSSGGYNWWWNDVDMTDITGDPSDTVGTPGPLAKAAGYYLANNPVDVMHWGAQGTSDVTSVQTPSTKANYKACLKALFLYLRQCAGRMVPIDVRPLGTDNTAVDSGTQNIRDADMELTNELPLMYLTCIDYDCKFGTVQGYAASITQNNQTITTAISTGIKKNTMIEADSGALPIATCATAAAGATSVPVSANPTLTNASDTIRILDNVHRLGADYGSSGTLSGQPQYPDTNEYWYRTARKLAANMPRIFQSSGSQKYGPQATAFVAVAGQPYCYLDITHDQGTDLTTRNGDAGIANIGFFYNITDNGAQRPVTSSTKVGTTVVSGKHVTRLQFGYAVANTAGNTMTMTPCSGAANRQGWMNFLLDNAPVPMGVVPCSPTNSAAMTITVAAA